jgi:Uma2 family endonuclease
MSEWIDNGAALAWLIEPATRSVTIYRPGRQPETVAPADTLAAEGPLQGFILSLPRVWDPLGS